MFDRWRLRDYAPGEGSTAGAFKDGLDDTHWLDVPVPGDVHRALMSTGHIEDPFYDRNEARCAWIEDREWWYRTSIRWAERTASARRAAAPRLPRPRHLRHRLAQRRGDRKHANMFREAVFDVGGRVRFGEENTLAILFDRPLDHAGEEHPDQWGRNPERVFMRKAQFGFGWDWGPRLPTVGIWRPVELRRERRAAIAGVHFHTLDLAPTEQAAVAVRVEAERFAGEEPVAVDIALSTPDGDPVAEHAHGPRRGADLAGTAYLTVENPRLWWTHDLGKPVLYGLRVDLHQEDEVLDHYESRVGIRTLELDQSPDPDEPGTRFFRFVLNGVPIFARGADWIPADSFVGGIEDERYDDPY